MLKIDGNICSFVWLLLMITEKESQLVSISSSSTCVARFRSAILTLHHQQTKPWQRNGAIFLCFSARQKQHAHAVMAQGRGASSLSAALRRPMTAAAAAAATAAAAAAVAADMFASQVRSSSSARRR